jgi:hypothetical protein
MNPDLTKYISNISASGLSIYQPIDIEDINLWIPSTKLEEILNNGLKGLSLEGLPLRTRSKVAKAAVCKVLGYSVPPSFQKTNPRFPGQNLDIYIQKSNNLQIWNEEISPLRRYAIIRVDSSDTVTKVRVFTGEDLALLDTTGTLTQKYQARITPGDAASELVNDIDTVNLQNVLGAQLVSLAAVPPTKNPVAGELIPIARIFESLEPLIGQTISAVGIDQERNRGAGLHSAICKQLGYGTSADDGKFPDVRHQLLEIKLQTSPTIDLGLVSPDSEEILDVPPLGQTNIRHCDVRYAIFYGKVEGSKVHLTNLYLASGEAFFTRFPKFQGKIINKKLQIPLPSRLFS